MNDIKPQSSALLFIGNGFDLALGYKTSYLNFYRCKCFKELKGNSICDIIKKPSEKSKWSDLEKGLYKYSLSLSNPNNKGNYSDANKFNAEFNEIKRALYDYLINVKRKPNWDDTTIKTLIMLWKNLSPQVVSFNYTHYIINELMDENKDNDMDRFILIHGSLDKTDEDHIMPIKRIVLGIDDHQKVEDFHSFLYKSNQARWNIDKLQQSINDHTNYIIHGCSMDKSDEVYFKMLFNKNRTGKRYLIYGKDMEGVVSMQEFVNEYADDVNGFYKRNEVVFSATDEYFKCVKDTIRFIDKSRLGINPQK